MGQQFEENMDKLLQIIGGKPETETILWNLAIAVVFAGIMLFTYRLANTKATYRPEFAVTLATLALVSTILMELIQSNLALSLGMLGSLSIVRFRTNIRDPRDIGFIFWSMAVGIASATQSYFIGVAGSVVLAGVMLFTKRTEEMVHPMLLVIRGSNSDLDRIQDIVAGITEYHTIKAKNILSDSFEIVYEVKCHRKEENHVIGELFELGGIDSVNLLAQNLF